MNVHLTDDFTPRSAGRSKCYLSRQDKRPEDPGVISTGVMIEQGDWGELDLSIAAVEELAQHIGWLPPAYVARIEAERDYHKAVAEDAVAQFQASEAAAKAAATSHAAQIKMLEAR